MRRALLALQLAILHAQTDIDGYLLSLGLPSGLEPLTIRFSAPQRDAKKKILLREGETFTLPGDSFLSHPPSVSWDSETEDDKYALLMFDQDAPRPVSKPCIRCWWFGACKSRWRARSRKTNMQRMHHGVTEENSPKQFYTALHS